MDNASAPKPAPVKYVVFPTGGEAVIVRRGGDGEMVSVDFDEVGRVLAERDRLKALNATLVAALEDAVHNLEHGYTISPGGTILPRFRAALAAAKGGK